MRKNMGVVDRIIRLGFAAAIGALVAIDVIGGVLAVVAGIVGVILAATALVGYCPIYEPFGIKTCKVVDPVEVNQTQLIDSDDEPVSKETGSEQS